MTPKELGNKVLDEKAQPEEENIYNICIAYVKVGKRFKKNIG